MMEGLVLYSLKSSICLAILFSAYYLLVRCETFIRTKRFILLGIIASSLVLPVMKIQSYKLPAVGYPVQRIEKALTFASETSLSAESNVIITRQTAVSRRIPLLIIVFLCGVFIQSIVLIVSCARIARIILKGRKVSAGEYIIIIISGGKSPFSFGRFIIIPEKNYNSQTDIIVMHEKIHLSRYHGIDLILAELFLIMNWYNPFSWLLMQEIRINHEFEADRSMVLQGYDPSDYQMLLVKSASKYNHIMFANHFAQSKIKTRIAMMNKHKSGQLASVKTLLFIPLVALVLQLFARPELIQPSNGSGKQMTTKFLNLNIDQLNLIGIHCTKEGVFYKNANPKQAQDKQKYGMLCFFLTDEVYCCNISLRSADEKISGSEAPYRELKKLPVTTNDFYPVLITSFAGHPTWDSYRVLNDSTIKLLPVQINMADLGLKSRKDTIVFWFKPTSSLKEAFAGIVNTDKFLQAPDAAALGPMPQSPKAPQSNEKRK